LKSCGCDFCNDLRNIEPAKYIGGGDKKTKEFLDKAKKEKRFIYHYNMYGTTVMEITDKCPNCGYEFTEEDYDSYL
jgi:hypothetical protein